MTDAWDAVAADWEANIALSDAQLGAATELMLDRLGLEPGGRVIDLACGPGTVGLAAAERVGPSATVILSDGSAGMLAVAARRAAGLHHVRTDHSDQSAIGFPAGHFDGVACRHGLMFAPDPAAAVAEAVRVLRPGGRYAAMTWDRRERNPWLGTILDAVSAQFGAPFPPPGIPGPFSLEDEDVLAGALEGGGLAGITVERVATPFRLRSLDLWWEIIPKLAGPLGPALAALDPAVRTEIAQRARANAEAAARSCGEGVELDGSVLVGSGTRA